MTRVFQEASEAVQAVLPCTALDGGGVEAVRAWAAGAVPEGPPLYDKVRMSLTIAVVCSLYNCNQYDCR